MEDSVEVLMAFEWLGLGKTKQLDQLPDFTL